MEEENIEDIFKRTLNDPSLFSTLDIKSLLKKDKNNEYLENKTAKMVAKDIYDIVSSLVDMETTATLCKKLVEYRYVDEIRELHKGKHVRWIAQKKMQPVLTNGGIVVDILFKDNGIHVLCKNAQHRFIQYKFDECFTFQKLTLEEQLILSAFEYLTPASTTALKK